MKWGCRGSRGLGSGQGGLWSGVGGRGCIIIAKYCMEGLHFLHADVIGGSQVQLMHGGRWVYVLEYRLLIEVWGAKGSLAESINKCPKCLALFLPDAEE